MALFASDKRFIEFGPAGNKPGADLDFEFTAVEGQRYYLQVFGQNGTAGAYTLTIK